jgi:SAM-dependent methyltransferase
LVERIVTDSPGPDVLEVGIGTGIAARQFRAAGCRVLGVEGDARMADRARRHGLEVLVAAFEDWDPAGRTFDAVISGQAWHWVQPVTGARKAAEVLRPCGRLTVFWNFEQPRPEVAEVLSEVYRRVAPDSLAARRWAAGSTKYSTVLTTAADAMREVGAFEDHEQWRFDWTQTYSRDEWLDLLPTHSDHRQLPDVKQAEVLAGVAAAIDSVGGSLSMDYHCVAVSAARSVAVEPAQPRS